jgi:uncharacterized membrane protein
MEVKRTKAELVKMLIKQDLHGDDEAELLDLLINNPITVDVNTAENTELTFGEKVADRLSEVAGSWTFIICFGCFLVCWMIINGIVLFNQAIDPFPFILLNLMLSCLAAIQAPIIMMSQNRQSKKDSIRNQNDYRVDLKSELILEDLHKRMDTLSKNQNIILKYIEEKRAQEEPTEPKD